MLRLQRIKHGHRVVKVSATKNRRADAGASIFSKLGLRSVHRQLRIREEDEPETAFVSEFGHYQWPVASFGLISLPAYFSRLMTDILQRFIGRFVVVYLDDILVYSRNKEEHQEHLRQVFLEQRRHHLYLHPTKTELFLQGVTDLGFRIEKGGISIDDGTVKQSRN
mmetsp:Transcript_27698/g.108637  ORF Transcript_27698/g.108637 Transcript_27698/m.108637 type:complete len:166 (-) Transcript_27698:1562-2059(-)